MAQAKVAVDNLPLIPGARIAIVQSKWYREYTDTVVARCSDILQGLGAELIELSVVPGSLEIPLAARTILRSGKGFEALVAVGVVLKGETLHFDVVVDQCCNGLSRVMFEEDTPIIMEIIPALNLDQIVARCSDNEFNKGIEAASAAAEIISWRRGYGLTLVG